MRHWLMMLLAMAVATGALAQSGNSPATAQDIYPLATEAERERFDRLLNELRCPKCQNQNIADSNAPIAKDMRDEVYQMMKGGAGNQEIVESLVGVLVSSCAINRNSIVAPSCFGRHP